MLAEGALLRIASAIDARAGEDVDDLADALGLVAQACADTSYLRARLDATGHAPSSLALGFAREQLRLALEALVERELAADRLRTDLPVAALSRILLLGAEGLAHEPASDVAERIDLLIRAVQPLRAD